MNAILVHELCHARRRDNLAAAFHMVVETLFWFHPLVWWIERRLVDERERACDEEVLRVVGAPETYAEGILNVCRFYKQSPLVCVSGVTGSNLKRRIEDIMTNRIVQRLGIAKTLLLAVAAIAAVAAPIGLGMASMASMAQSVAQTAPRTPDPVKTSPIEASKIAGPQNVPAKTTQTAAQPQQTTALGYIDQIANAGYKDIDVDQLIAFKIHGIEPDYIRDIRAAGYDPTPDELVAFKIHGITPDYISEMRAAGLQLGTDSLVAFRIHGVTADYISQIKQTGVSDINEDNLIAFKIHGAEPEWIRQIKALGFSDVSADDLIALRVHGVTADFISEARKRFKDIRLDQLWQLKQLDLLNSR
jgi:BlaR1 peptidase M56